MYPYFGILIYGTLWRKRKNALVSHIRDSPQRIHATSDHKIWGHSQNATELASARNIYFAKTCLARKGTHLQTRTKLELIRNQSPRVSRYAIPSQSIIANCRLLSLPRKVAAPLIASVKMGTKPLTAMEIDVHVENMWCAWGQEGWLISQLKSDYANYNWGGLQIVGHTPDIWLFTIVRLN